MEDAVPGKKKCSRCFNPDLTITDFYSSGERRMSWCKECHRKYSAQLRKNRLLREGQMYRDKENARVRQHMSTAAAADHRRAAERAKQAALRELRIRHGKEYRELLSAARSKEGLA